MALSASATLAALMLLTASGWLTLPAWTLQAFSDYPANRTVISGTVARAELPALPQPAPEPANGDSLPSR